MYFHDCPRCALHVPSPHTEPIPTRCLSRTQWVVLVGDNDKDDDDAAATSAALPRKT